MEVTKEKVLESMSTYCSDRKYGTETLTLTDGFKEKFANFFTKKYEGKDVEEADLLADLHFNLDTAHSAAVNLKTVLDSDFTTKENNYKNQIAELNKKIAKPKEHQEEPPKFEMPDEVKEQLKELQKFKDEEAKKNKFNEIVNLAKKDIRQDLHGEFDIFIRDYEVKNDVSVEDQAKRLHSRFQEIFKSKIGDIKPLAPKQVQKQEDDFIDALPKVKVQ
jgi:hypothetical protein